MDFDSESIASLAADIGDGISGARLHGAMVGGLCGGGADEGVWEPVLEAALGDAPIGALEAELRQMLAPLPPRRRSTPVPPRSRSPSSPPEEVSSPAPPVSRPRV